VREKDLESTRKDSLVQEWKKNPLNSKIDIENIDDEWDKYKR
jgi:hypothetical protein